MSIPTDERTQLARQILADILRENGPQLGAKLKVRLTQVLGERLGLPVDARHGLLPRLSHFLAANADLVSVQRPAGPGDIRVSLRADAEGHSTAPNETARVWYRPEVWTAFVNPDPVRRRFYHRHEHEVVHFSTGSGARPQPAVVDRVTKDPAFVEIQFATAAEQGTWLREFLDKAPLISEVHKRVARHFIEVPFDSSINAAFAASLGPHGDAWRRFRAKKVDDHIVDWAKANNIDVAALKHLPAQLAVATPTAHTADGGVVPEPLQPNSPASDLRAQLLRVVEALEDAELRQLLVPLSAVERILRLRS
ncbi:MAG: hypothetical protein U0P30_14925 [Vicinamibacterales bacterium]